MNIKQAHAKRIPFYMASTGKFYDYESGAEFFNPHAWSGPYAGLCFVGGDVFQTWMDNGERAWRCVAVGI